MKSNSTLIRKLKWVNIYSPGCGLKNASWLRIVKSYQKRTKKTIKDKQIFPQIWREKIHTAARKICAFIGLNRSCLALASEQDLGVYHAFRDSKRWQTICPESDGDVTKIFQIYRANTTHHEAIGASIRKRGHSREMKRFREDIQLDVREESALNCLIKDDDEERNPESNSIQVLKNVLKETIIIHN